MSTTSALGWQLVARHKIVTVLVAVAAGVALTIARVLTLGSYPAASQTGPTPTVQQPAAPNYHLDCDTRLVVSFC